MERLYRETQSDKKMGGGLKDRPRCERCGRPVKITSDDYLQEEILCTHCALEGKSTEFLEYEGV